MNHRLTTFLLVSLLAHAVPLLWSEEQPQLELAIGGQAQALRVTLATGRTVTPSPREIAALETAALTQAATVPDNRPAPSRSGKQSTPIAHRSAMQQPQRRLTHAQTVAAAAQPRQQASSVNVSAHISAALQNQLSKRFEYPWLARKRGWQGMVTLSLQVEDDGKLTHWTVSKTSGHSLLDRSALKAAQGIGRLQEADELLDGESLNLSIPVRYRLLDG